ncbi:MAG: sulfate ABC transporter ATP-binding protein [Candidatus Accumulibacter phosphatis]|uniref:Sulfate ABC transporter ATP-binding protein n=3 Tax=Candidatus Accumulibacter TaxID=327159 RepID=A0A080M7H9_9PROT|nr:MULTISPECIES: sulfate ABC transporter ATP-binding protein [Candidatus Accumulibacter]KFB76936.1 MAG: Sulfate/thiosulfate import ATP-binding protein CysA [Candidatus Accumulibacter cognatus]MBL8401328.1 sulfate ABC transporter ATP-binding protein [Accumulibacter sp.]MCC2866472.1 sulfate ABC transporter ATP-binding protein [Candidatus Accumulibacter phosphatis]MCM8579905.1 sulfate ABC transporter ATP-binding protein [Accumulibacter sp.]MCM8622951.1 sulfate ABC transporter ATP-binding protein 
MSIEIRGIGKRFGNFVALEGINLHIPTGELVALLGPSGCGKTTLLRIIAGMESADVGQVLFAGEEVAHVHARDRKVGFVFQHYALFRHMSVFENVAFGLRVKTRKVRPAEAEIRSRVTALLKLVQLDWLADRYPSQLSGGQRQRIALARALAVEPRVLLLDEPFGALDTQVRKELRRWLRRLHDEMQISSVFVTHDQEEALEVADRVVVMNQGRIEQIGSPDDVYSNPATPFVYQFLGNVNVFHSRVHGAWAEVAAERLEGGPESGVTAFVRPHDIEIEHHPVTGSLEAMVQEVHAIGPWVRVELAHASELIEVELTRERATILALAEGQLVWFKPRQLRVFAAPGKTMEEGGSGI